MLSFPVTCVRLVLPVGVEGPGMAGERLLQVGGLCHSPKSPAKPSAKAGMSDLKKCCDHLPWGACSRARSASGKILFS